jgi:hypothetical protein
MQGRPCHRQFSATIGTSLACHKLPFRTLLMAFSLFVTAAKGLTATWVFMPKSRSSYFTSYDAL